MLKGETRHELSCSACGAPLHELKMLRKEKKPERAYPKHSKDRRAAWPDHKRPSKPRKKTKRRKRFFKDLFEEAFDVIEDIFD